MKLIEPPTQVDNVFYSEIQDETTLSGHEVSILLYLKLLESDLSEMSKLSREHQRFWLSKVKQLALGARRDLEALKGS